MHVSDLARGTWVYVASSKLVMVVRGDCLPRVAEFKLHHRGTPHQESQCSRHASRSGPGWASKNFTLQAEGFTAAIGIFPPVAH